MRRRSHSGLSLVLATLVLAIAAAGALFLQASVAAAGAQRERVTERALGEAREALLSYASDRAITAAVGPGHLPCPDLDDDGWAESTCGSLAGDRGQDQRLGRLPWKTLGLDDVRDGAGERLWYAVSTRYKGLLNCAASAACVDLTPASAAGTISVRDASGRVVHDGTLATPVGAGAIAVVIAPGAPLDRLPAGSRAPLPQRRGCVAGECDATGRCATDPPTAAQRCDPRNFLDAAPAERSGEDNADFHDRSDAGRARNGNGFIQGPVARGSGELAVNDRLAVITHADLMPRVMKRVALEVAQCLAYYASRPENRGRLPLPAPACAGPPMAFGRVPDTPFEGAAEHAALERWWRATSRDPERLAELPTLPQACRIAVPPADEAPTRRFPAGSPAREGATAGTEENAWWTHWRRHVLYAPAPALRLESPASACDDPTACLDWLDAQGRLLAAGRRAAVVVTETPDACGSALLQCEATRCRAVSEPASNREVLVTLP